MIILEQAADVAARSEGGGSAGSVERVDFARDAAPFPKIADSLERGPSPTANTYFREAPVRVLVSFDIYEFDEARAAALKKSIGL